MKRLLGQWILGLALLAGIHQGLAQTPLITSFSQNGTLVCSNLFPGSVASIEWASSPSGPWYTNWTSLVNTPVAANGTITLSVPMFYRVRGFNTNFFSSDGTVLIPAGTFTMGDSLDGDVDAIPTQINVSAFYMDTNLVSFSQWQTVYDWATNNGYGFFTPGNVPSGSGNYPVANMTWFDCLKWCNARSQRAGLAPVYYTDAGLTMVYTNGQPGGTQPIFQNLSGKGYRLPTEGEWEKAARGQIAGARFPYGNTISASQANYTANTSTNYDLGPNGNAWGNAPSPVGSFPPNGYGLYDMAGNIYVWCWDVYGATPGLPTTTNPTGPDTGFRRIVRGGSYVDNAYYLRAGYRSRSDFSVNFKFNQGLRCVRTQ